LKQMENMLERVTNIIRGEAHLYPDCRSITLIKTDEWKVYTPEEAHEQVKAHPGSIIVLGGGEVVPLIPVEREGKKYVRTKPEDTTADNLLKVKDC
jgi:hypothetical protein